MINRELWNDIIKSDRADVAQEIYEQYADLFEQYETQEELYENAPTELLYKLTVNGDNDACAYYIKHRIEEGTLVSTDMDYLKAAVYNFSFKAALVGGLVYGMKGSPYQNSEMEYFSYVVLEQSGYKEAHKRLEKAYKKDSQRVGKAEDRVLHSSVDRWGAEFIRGELLGIRADIKRMEKESGFPDYKTAYLTDLYLTETTGRETEGEPLFVGYLRGKNRDDDLKRMTDNIIDEIVSVADKMRIPTVDVYLDGKRFYHYGGGNQTKKAEAQKDGVHIISDADLTVNVTDETLKSDICPACGGAMGADGVCKSCGYRGETDEKNGIYIKRSKDAEALICTQCGSPVLLEAGGNTAFCTACGTTFVINGNALKFEIPGLNYENIRADMPEGASLPDVKFVRAGVADDRVTAIMPKNFIVMSEEMRRIKYRANAPRYIYTTPDSTVNLTMNIKGALKESDVFAFGQQMLGALKGVYPAAKFGEAQLITRKRNIFFFDFITAGLDQTIYNAMFFFSFGGDRKSVV